ncbi:FadR/GntR family transcriptional regulator [Bacillus niameyensis]|uniref:FadR/GntR family transcriptional regulator n=1 Tax=Bacillus niameyensis TaxID=1522308 RepID=UPI001E3E12E0|nr:FadR/GntR family transcriptional regulator [Bacillus niameyensis]
MYINSNYKTVIALKPIQDNERFTLSKIVSDDLREYIVQNNLTTGDRLPSERDLSAQLNVSRVVVREALRSLEATGMITIRHGEGAFVNTDDPSIIFNHLLYFWKINNQNVKELLDLRILLEKSAIEQIIHHTDTSYLEALEKVIQKMELTNDPEAFKRYDAEFHMGLIQATRNGLFNQLADIILQYFNDMPSLSLTDIEKETTLHEHRSIINALKESNKEKALELLKLHLQHSKVFRN